MKCWPLKRSFMSEYYRNKNVWNSEDKALFIGRFQGVGDSFRSLMQFDLSKLVTDDFDKACLIMDIIRNEIPQGSSQIGIYRVLQDWEEKDVAWESAPAQAVVPELTFTIASVWTGLIIVDLTVLVRRWLDHTYPNFGIVLIGDESSNSLIAVSNPPSAAAEKGPHIITFDRKL